MILGDIINGKENSHLILAHGKFSSNISCFFVQVLSDFCVFLQTFIIFEFSFNPQESDITEAYVLRYVFCRQRESKWYAFAVLFRQVAA